MPGIEQGQGPGPGENELVDGLPQELHDKANRGDALNAAEHASLVDAVREATGRPKSTGVEISEFPPGYTDDQIQALKDQEDENTLRAGEEPIPVATTPAMLEKRAKDKDLVNAAVEQVRTRSRLRSEEAARQLARKPAPGLITGVPKDL